MPNQPYDSSVSSKAVQSTDAAAPRLLGVGDTIWYFNINRRVYPAREFGKPHASLGPIYREHWVATKIIGETTRSWLCEYGRKCAKKGDRLGWALSEAEVDDDCFVSEERHRIADAVLRTRDAATLREVARIIGYQATT